MSAKRPAYGEQRYTLRGSGPYVIEHMVFTDAGTTSVFDEETCDFLTWQGSWERVQTFDGFATKEQATEFMVARCQTTPLVGEER